MQRGDEDGGEGYRGSQMGETQEDDSQESGGDGAHDADAALRFAELVAAQDDARAAVALSPHSHAVLMAMDSRQERRRAALDWSARGHGDEAAADGDASGGGGSMLNSAEADAIVEANWREQKRQRRQGVFSLAPTPPDGIREEPCASADHRYGMAGASVGAWTAVSAPPPSSSDESVP